LRRTRENEVDKESQNSTSIHQSAFSEKSINEKITLITQHSGNKAKRSEIKIHINELEKLVHWHGLEEEQLSDLLNLVFSAKLDVADTKRIIKLLIPRQKISENLVIKILGKLGHELVIHSIQGLLLRWIILVYPLLEDYSRLQKLYGVIFHFLEYQGLRINLLGRFGNEPNLIGLIRIYKDYYPNYVMVSIPSTRKAIFKCPDSALQLLILQVQRRWNALNDLSIESSLNPPLNVKRRKVNEIIIPKAETSNVTKKSATIKDVINFKQLASKIDKLELPDQLASALDNRMLQHILICNPERITLMRITNWLSQCLLELTYWSDQNIETKSRLTNLLEKLIVMTEFIKELLPIFEDFLKKFIITWDGEQNRDLIFRLLTYIKPQAFNDLYRDFLFHLHRLFSVSSADWKAKLILCYATLLRYWASLIAIKSDSRESLDQTNDSTNHFIFGQLDPDVDYMESIQKFILYCDDISIVALEVENDDITVQHAVLSLYERVISLQIENNWDKLVMPSSSIIYRCFFSSSGMALSRVCEIILHYKLAFDKREKSAIQLGMPRHNRSYVNHFNSFVMDICNCLWRSHPFSKTDKNAKGFQLEK
ncbi:7903_t:CDS:10, partial [Ambispora leptoticha]